MSRKENDPEKKRDWLRDVGLVTIAFITGAILF